MEICEVPNFGLVQVYWDPEAHAFGAQRPGAFVVYIGGRHQEGADGEGSLVGIVDMLQKQFPDFALPSGRSVAEWEAAIKEEAQRLKWTPSSVDGEEFFFLTPNEDGEVVFFDTRTQAAQCLEEMGYHDGQQDEYGRIVTVLAVPAELCR